MKHFVLDEAAFLDEDGQDNRVDDVFFGAYPPEDGQ